MSGPFTESILQLNDRQVIERLYATGHFRNPLVEQTWEVTELQLPMLGIDDKPVLYAAASYQDFLPREFNALCSRIHGRAGDVDGVVGPATRALLGLPRCELPDFKEAYAEDQFLTGEATGSGNWRGCHGVGNFHSAVCRIDERGMPSHVSEIWTDVLTMVQAADAAKGLLWRFVDRTSRDVLNGDDLSGEHVDTELSFVNRSRGWIGLALIGNGIQCRQATIWLRLLSTYGRSYDRNQRALQWAELVLHELTHNKSWGHTRGGVMNPTIGTVRLPPSWEGDPLDEAHDAAYGGVPVPIPGSGPPAEKTWTHLTLKDEHHPGDDFTLTLNPPWPRGGESTLASLHK